MSQCMPCPARRPIPVLPAVPRRRNTAFALILAAAALLLPGCGESDTTLVTLAPIREGADVPGNQVLGAPVANPLAISSTFGPRWKFSESRFDFHRGIDYFGNLGDPILSIGDGVVSGVFPDGSAQFPNGGNTVIVRYAVREPFSWHGATVDRVFAVYLHLQSILVVQDQAVSAGETIATMGATGSTSFVHLHFETRIQTTCSLEFQRNNPAAACAQWEFDPHVHPYVFVGGENEDDGPRLTAAAGSPFTVTYEAGRGDLDLNIVRTDGGELNFNRRTGIDASTTAALDDFDYGWIVVEPDAFLSGSETIGYTFRFPAQPAYLEVVDLHGVGFHWSLAE